MPIEAGLNWTNCPANPLISILLREPLLLRWSLQGRS